MEVLGIGPMELLLILIIALMVFGPDRLPEIGAKLGQGMRSVRRATREFSREIEETRQIVEGPLSEIKQPISDLTQPLQELKQPFQDLKQPFREMGQAAQELPGLARESLTLAAGTVNAAAIAAPSGNGTGTLPAGWPDQEPAQAGTALDFPMPVVSTVVAAQPDVPAAEAERLARRRELAPVATGVINPQEALRQIIARQMQPEPRAEA